MTGTEMEHGESLPYRVDIGTACLGNPGPAAWAATMTQPDGWSQLLSASLANATSPETTLRAILAVLLALPPGTEGEVSCRDKATLENLNSRLAGWEANGWRTTSKKPVKNLDLWMMIAGARKERSGVRFEWAAVPGSVGTAMEAEATSLAKIVEARQAY